MKHFVIIHSGFKIILIALFVCLTAFIIHQAEADTIGSWEFEEGSGDAAADSSGNNNDGTLEPDEATGPQWTDGFIGYGLEFDNDYDYVDCDNYSNFNLSLTGHSIELWFNLSENQICNYEEGFPTTGYQIKITEDGKVYYEEASDGEDSISIKPETPWSFNAWHHLIVTVDLAEKTAHYYMDGKYIASDTYTGDLVSNASNLYLGGGGPSTNYSFKGRMDQVTIHDYALTAQEVLASYNNDKYLYGFLFASYAFEEGSGAIAQDSSDYENDATLMNSPQWTDGVVGGGLEFDNDNDYLDCGTDVGYNLASTDHSLELWFNPAQNQVCNYTGGVPEAGYQIKITADGKVYYEEATDGSNPIRLHPDIQYSPGLWHHLVITVSTSEKIARYYLDGEYITSDDYTGELVNIAGNLYLGGGGPSTNYSFKGKMDQVNVYAKTLTSQEVLEHYINDKYNYGLLLLAYAFEEGSGATVIDSSDYANDGTLEPDEANGPQWIAGQIGGGLEFDDEDDYVDCGTDSRYILASTDHSIELWFNLAENQVCNYTGYPPEAGYQIKTTADGKVYYEEAADGGDSIAIHPETQYNPNTWHHLVVTVSTSTKAAHYYMDGEYITSDTYTGELVGTNGNLYLGGGGPGTDYSFQGKIDQVKVYARTLTAQEVSQHYHEGSLILYYAFEEGTGDTALDSSGYENDGTLINGPQWVTGKVGLGLEFDDDDDYVNCGNLPEYNLANTDHSIEAWFKASPPTDDYARIVSRMTGGYPGAGYLITMRTTGQIDVGERSDGSAIWIITNSDYGDDQWHHVVYVVDTEEKKGYLYIDGFCIGQDSYTDNLLDYNYPLTIGGCISEERNWNGIIDEVKIYRRALTAEEIFENYGGGSLVGHWKMDEASWDGTTNEVVDSSNYGNHGTAMTKEGASVPTTISDGVSNRAGIFDGDEQQYVKIPSNQSFQPSSTLTLEAWAKWEEGFVLSGNDCLIGKSDSYQSKGYWLVYNQSGSDKRIEFRLGYGESGSYDNYYLRAIDNDLEDGKFHHIVAIFDKPNVYIYIDGELAASGTHDQDILYAGHQLNLGCYSMTSYVTGFFDGTLDEAKVYCRALSEEEIEENYNIINTTYTPEANDDSYNVSQDTSLNQSDPGVLANDTDPNDDTLTAILVTDVSHGTLTLNSNGSFGYTPTTGYSGLDTFTYKANDGTDDSNIATALITISTTEFSPTANGDSYTISKDSTMEISIQQGVLSNDLNIRGNRTTVYKYSNFGNLNLVRDPENNTTYYTWDDNQNRIAITDANGNNTSYTYDDKGNLLTITQPTEPVQAITTFTYEPTYNLVTSITDPLEQTTNYTYDTQGNLLSVTDAASNTTSYTYNTYGQLLSQSYNNHQHTITTDYTYDTYGNLYTLTDNQDNLTTLNYDIIGNLESVIDARDNITTYDYDLNNNLLTIIYPDSTATVTYAYDGSDNRISVTDQKDNQTTYTYNQTNLLTQVTDANDGITAYTYDKEGNRTMVTDANENTTSYTYDKLNRLTKVQTALDNITTYTYDANGNRLTCTDPEDNTLNYAYDTLNRLTNITYPDTSTVTFAYDLAGRRTSMTDSNGTTAYTYDQLNRLIELNGPGTNDTICYTYDSAGNRIEMTDHDSSETDYTYDNLNRLQTITNPDNETTTYTYDEENNLITTLYPNNAQTDYTYDNLNRLLTLTNENATQTVISSYSYTYDDNGMRTGVTLANSDTITYTYDVLNQLTSEIKKDSTQQQLYSYDYTNGFDPVGNRLALSKDIDPTVTNIQNPSFWDASGTSEISYVYNAENQLTQATAEVGTETWIAEYEYDDNGNTISKTEYEYSSPATTEITTYEYDYENRLIEITYPDLSTSTYTYDGVGKRIKTVEKDDQGTPTSTTKFYYDGLNVIIERDETDTTKTTYTRGLSYGGGIGGVISKTTATGTTYFHYDGIGTVTELTDENSTVVQEYNYEAYGNLLYSTGSETNNHQFQTKEYCDKSALSYFGARYYDPRVGRWTQKDPLGMIDGPNLYKYCANDPVNLIDPLGLAKLFIKIPKPQGYNKWPKNVQDKWNDYQKSRFSIPTGPSILDIWTLIDMWRNRRAWKKAYNEWKNNNKKECSTAPPPPAPGESLDITRQLLKRKSSPESSP